MTYFYQNRKGRRSQINRDLYMQLVLLDLIDYVLRDTHVEVVRDRRHLA